MPKRLALDTPATYVIKIQGTLGVHWSDYIGGLEIAIDRQLDPPVTTLSGSIVDQAALLGALNNLYNLGFPLLAVECRGEKDEKEKKLSYQY